MTRDPEPTQRTRDPFAHLRVPTPPPELAAQVLAAALAESAGARADWSARLLASSAARLAWAAAICALLAGHALASRSLPTAQVGASLTPTSADSARALAALLDLPAQTLDHVASVTWSRPASAPDSRGVVRRDLIEAVLVETGG